MRGARIGGVAFQELVAGSKIWALPMITASPPWSPPETRTFPFCRSVAVAFCSLLAIWLVRVQEPVWATDIEVRPTRTRNSDKRALRDIQFSLMFCSNSTRPNQLPWPDSTCAKASKEPEEPQMGR